MTASNHDARAERNSIRAALRQRDANYQAILEQRSRDPRTVDAHALSDATGHQSVALAARLRALGGNPQSLNDTD